jgi:hypothetical protein
MAKQNRGDPVFGELVMQRPDGSTARLPVTPSSIPAIHEMNQVAKAARRTPEWVRRLWELGFCRARPGDPPHLWLARQVELYAVWHDYLEPALKLKLATVCAMFCDEQGQKINPDSVSKHGGGEVLNPEIKRKLSAFFWPESPEKRPPAHT